MRDNSSWGVLGTLWGTVVALSLLSLAACFVGPTPQLIPMPPHEPTALEWKAAAENVARADGILVGSIAEIVADWQYDDPCGAFAAALHKCDGTVTYRVKLENAQTHHYVWAFTPSTGAFGLFEGEQAIFLWHKTVAYRFATCKSQQALTSAYCNYDVLDAFQSDFDVLPAADSARVAAIRQTR